MLHLIRYVRLHQLAVAQGLSVLHSIVEDSADQDSVATCILQIDEFANFPLKFALVWTFLTNFLQIADQNGEFGLVINKGLFFFLKVIILRIYHSLLSCGLIIVYSALGLVLLHIVQQGRLTIQTVALSYDRLRATVLQKVLKYSIAHFLR
jgi:hypothetical protein